METKQIGGKEITWILLPMLLLLAGCSGISGPKVSTILISGNTTYLNITNNNNITTYINVTTFINSTVFNITINDTRYIVNLTSDKVSNDVTLTICRFDAVCFNTTFTVGSGGGGLNNIVSLSPYIIVASDGSTANLTFNDTLMNLTINTLIANANLTVGNSTIVETTECDGNCTTIIEYEYIY